MSSTLAAADDGDWLASLFQPLAAKVLRAYSVRVLHHAHAVASARYKTATWTSNTTFGTDRYHCLCSKLGAAVESKVPYAQVHYPQDEFASPFLIDFGSAALYVHRYGSYKTDPHQGLTLRKGWLRDQLVHRQPATQPALSFPNLPDIPISQMAFLAYAGNRTTGLERAFLATGYLDSDGKLCWDEPVEELDVKEGLAFALPGIEDAQEPPRHSLDFFPVPAGTEQAPAFDLQLLDTDSNIDLRSLFSADASTTGDTTFAEDDIEEDDELDDNED